jgi:uncharacterized membrane-anchored protein YjiN (DUF445 family)
LSARKAAKIFNIAHSTITRRIRRTTKARMLISQAQQLLTPVEEQTIIKWIINGGYHWVLSKFVNSQLKSLLANVYNTRAPYFIGEHWHQIFIDRNSEIKQIVARGLDRTRASAMLKIEKFAGYFELYESLQEKYEITLQDIYNINEKGFCIEAIYALIFSFQQAKRRYFYGRMVTESGSLL